MATKILRILSTKSFFSQSFHHHHHHHHHHPQNPQIFSQHRSIYATCRLDGWMDSIKGVFKGTKSTPTDSSKPSEDSFTLLQFADALATGRKMGSLKQYVVGSEATFADALQKQEAILRYLGKIDLNGENIQASQKQEAAKECQCTLADIENTLAKYTWTKEAQKKIQKLKDEGKPMPTSMEEVQKLMGSTYIDVARDSMAKSGSISRNAFCPCGSKKRYKRCCGKDK